MYSNVVWQQWGEVRWGWEKMNNEWTGVHCRVRSVVKTATGSAERGFRLQGSTC